MSVFPAEGGGSYSGEVIGTDELRDLAVVRICCITGLRALEMAKVSEMRQGSEVVAFGYPYRARVLSGLSVSDGIISAVDYNAARASYLVQTDAAINPGNSGGPLVNKRGKVVGIVASKVERTPGGRPIDNIAFAVASRTIRARLADLEAGTGRIATATPTETHTPTPIPPPRVKPTQVPSGWDPVLVAVGDGDQRVLDANKRRVISDWLGISATDVPQVETGYGLVEHGDVLNNEVHFGASGLWVVTFAEITSRFIGYKPYLVSTPIKFYGRVCRDAENCDQAVFRELGDFVQIDEDVSGGMVDLAP